MASQAKDVLHADHLDAVADRGYFNSREILACELCRVLTGHNVVPQQFSISHYRSNGPSEMTRFVGSKVEFGADTDEFALNSISFS
jgi:hypothetical protein